MANRIAASGQGAPNGNGAAAAAVGQVAVTALPQPEADALESLYLAVERATKALGAARRAFAAGGEVQRLAPGAWVVTRKLQDAAQ